MTPAEIRTIRAALGLSLNGLAQALVVSRRTAARYLSGEIKLPAAKAAKLSDMASLPPS